MNLCVHVVTDISYAEGGDGDATEDEDVEADVSQVYALHL
jgi:hypothetical protein